MRASALADALKDFGAPPQPAHEPFAFNPDPEPSFDLPSFEEEPGFPAPDVDALVAEAVAQAEAALAERLEAEHAEAIQIERSRHEDELAELNQRFAGEASGRITDEFRQMEERLVELTTAVTARILGVALTDDLRQRSIDRLVETIREAIRDGEAVRIRVRGSQSLFEVLKAAIPEHADHLDFTESAGFDLSITIDDSVFETRLSEWSAALAETLS